MTKHILTDCDGVLLDWEVKFHEWMRAKGYNRIKYDIYNLAESYDIPTFKKYDLVRQFNNSSWIGELSSFRDAVEGINKLKNAGYYFTIITSLSLDPFSKKLRNINLNSVFGINSFYDLVCLDTGAEKDSELEKYKDSGLWWIEDKPENCEAGLRAGLKPILIDHLHNQYYHNPKVIRVKTWRDVCDVIGV